MELRRSLYASGGMHAALILWLALDGVFHRAEPPPDFQVTGVTIMSIAEFEAMSQSVPAVPVALQQPEVLLPQPEAAPLAPPTAEAPPPRPRPPEVTESPPPEAQPTPPPPAPQAEVIDDITAPPLPEAGDPTQPPSDTPTPEDIPRVAPTPAPTPAPEAEIAPEVVEQPSESAPASETAQEITPTAPEAATTEIVTEAERPSGGAPTVSVRPPSRPDRPAPVQSAAVQETPAPAPETPAAPTPAPEAPAEDAMAAAIAAAVAEAAATPAPAAPSGPPLTNGQRDGFRLAVAGCWNVGSLSTDALRTTIVVAFSMNRDGTPVGNSIRLDSVVDGTNAGAQNAFETARRAIIRCGASGYDLPEESYDQWREVEAVFNPEGMRLR
jgi:hypothetical protein